MAFSKVCFFIALVALAIPVRGGPVFSRNEDKIGKVGKEEGGGVAWPYIMKAMKEVSEGMDSRVAASSVVDHLKVDKSFTKMSMSEKKEDVASAIYDLTSGMKLSGALTDDIFTAVVKEVKSLTPQQKKSVKAAMSRQVPTFPLFFKPWEIKNFVLNLIVDFIKKIVNIKKGTTTTTAAPSSQAGRRRLRRLWNEFGEEQEFDDELA